MRLRKRDARGLACFLVLLVLLLTTGLIALLQHTLHVRFQRPFRNEDIRQFSQSASKELQDCTATSKSALCTWARQYSIANRKRPANWSPREGWQEGLGAVQSVRHASDRGLTAVGNSTSSNIPHKQSLQSVLHSLWPSQNQSDLPPVEPAVLPQCGALHTQACIAVVGAHCCNSLLSLHGATLQCARLLYSRECQCVPCFATRNARLPCSSGAKCHHECDMQIWR